MQTGLLISGIVLVAWSASAAADVGELRVLPDTLDGGTPGDMMSRYLLKQVDAAYDQWRQEYEERKSPDEIAAYQRRIREQFLGALGGFPERTPLNPQIAGNIQRDGYSIERVLFESRPRHYVTAALFLPDPDRHAPPHPGVLVPSGHALEAKAHDAYQTMGALLALNGMAALAFDPIEQGERCQLIHDDGTHVMWGTQAHTAVGIGAMLLGSNTATFEIWDGMRAIDYLQSRPEVDPERIGCTGNSGGGTQTAFLMALDDRIKAAAPSCYLNRVGRQLRTAPGDAEQNIYGQLAFGLDHADFLMMRAPMPVVVLAATHDYFDIHAAWETFRYAKRLYGRLGFPERVDLLENDRKHNYGKLQREGGARWLARWLLGRDEPIVEPSIELVREEDLWCTPQGQVMLLESARSVYDLNADDERRLAEERRRLWATTDRGELLERIRAIAGVRPLGDLPAPGVEAVGAVERDGYRIEKIVIQPEDGIYLPALLFVPTQGRTDMATLYLHESGKAADAGAGGAVEQLVRTGRVVLAVDVRGAGETAQTAQEKFGPSIGSDWEDVYKAYVLGRSYVGMRAEDVLVCARWLGERAPGGVDLAATGHVGVAALHAAALEPDLFASVRLSRALESWAEVVHARPPDCPLASAVHGALQVYDLPDLATLTSSTPSF